MSVRSPSPSRSHNAVAMNTSASCPCMVLEARTRRLLQTWEAPIEGIVMKVSQANAGENRACTLTKKKEGFSFEYAMINRALSELERGLIDGRDRVLSVSSAAHILGTVGLHTRFLHNERGETTGIMLRCDASFFVLRLSPFMLQSQGAEAIKDTEAMSDAILSTLVADNYNSIHSHRLCSKWRGAEIGVIVNGHKMQCSFKARRVYIREDGSIRRERDELRFCDVYDPETGEVETRGEVKRKVWEMVVGEYRSLEASRGEETISDRDAVKLGLLNRHAVPENVSLPLAV